MNRSACFKYLASYAEPESRSPALDRIEKVSALLVIPAYRERPDFLLRLDERQFSFIDKLLVILVSNHPSDLSGDKLETAVKCHLNLLNILPKASWTDGILSFYRLTNIDVLLVSKIKDDALNPKKATGLARKIGADIGLALINSGKCSMRWIYNTDADANLPLDYFKVSTRVPKSTAGIIYPFQHVGLPGKLLEATGLYEKRLVNYVAGLKFAGSPYAHQTLGSTIAVNGESYANIRGFPQKSAAEDFYLINKLVKQGSVESLEEPIIELESRVSDRIPFGTGPAVASLLRSTTPKQERIFYHPEVFSVLKEFLSAFNRTQKAFQNMNLSAEARNAAKQIDIDSFLKHVESQNLQGDHYRKHFHLWFDAFRTLKFLHWLRDNHFPDVSYMQLQALDFEYQSTI